MILVLPGGVTSETFVDSGGGELVYSGGIASGTTIENGGTLLISSGGSVTGTMLFQVWARSMWRSWPMPPAAPRT